MSEKVFYQPRYRAWLRALGLPDDEQVPWKDQPEHVSRNIDFMNFISRAWQIFRLTYHIEESFQNPLDPRFDEMLEKYHRQILELDNYLRPLERAEFQMAYEQRKEREGRRYGYKTTPKRSL